MLSTGAATDRTEHAFASAQEYKEALEAIRRHTGAVSLRMSFGILFILLFSTKIIIMKHYDNQWQHP